MNKIASIILSTLFLLVTVPVKSATDSDIEIIKNRIVSELLLTPVDDDEVNILLENIQDNGTWPGIDYEDVTYTGYEHRIHLANLVELSKAYNRSGSLFYHDTKIKKVFSKALDFWIEHDFIAYNWHTNEIANPRNWTAILFLMDDVLTEQQEFAVVDMAARANFNCWGARPGGDQIKIAGIAAELAIFRNNEQTLKKAIEIMANEIQISTGNGIKPDMAFHHRVDRVTSILSYGTGYAGAFSNWAVRLKGTKYTFPEKTTRLVVDFYLDGICKSMVYAWYKDPGAMNRGISRKGALKPIGPEISENLSEVSNYRKNELENISEIRKGELEPNLRSNRFFWHSEYQSHQRPDYFASVRMFSERNHNMEYPHNMESLKMHHYADGSSFISRTGKEYYDIFSVWDWQKIPGTTVVQKAELPSSQEIVKWGKTGFVGAVSDGIYGAATFDFDSPHDNLKAHKSWFFFDEEYACLGTDIQSDSNYPVVTTINQCLLNNDVVTNSNSKQFKLIKGSHILEKVSWVFHDSIAYIFPQPTDVSVNNKLYNGKWEDISKGTWAAKEKEEQKELFSLWIDHGKKPKNKAYSYIVNPAISVNEIEEYCKNAQVKILLNNSEIQAVQHLGLDLTQIVYYKAGTVEISKDLKISINQPGVVMIQMANSKIQKISVADPTRKLDDHILNITGRFEGSGKDWKSTWNKKDRISEIVVQLPQDGLAGKSVVMQNNENETFEPVQDISIGFEKPRDDGQHYIGEKYGGGVIIWLDEKREHGLIAATEDSKSEVIWENGISRVAEHYNATPDRVVNAMGDGIGAGEMNTLLIVSQQTQDKFYGEFAARVAVECKLGGYGDWYLPSKSELDILFELKDEIGGFESYSYWSSTEYNVGFAWGLGFKHYKSEFTFNKGSRNAVRCVRKF
jgi:chondroitin AC lyase